MSGVLKFFLILSLVLLAGEIALRAGFGFCDNVLVKADENLEYIAQPNQDRKIFGNNMFYNEYSMRSDKLDSNAIKILGLGDSVINGGTLTDQQDLATDILTAELTEEFKRNIQVLNIAYKSWGPDNAFAYLENYGNFGADILFLVVSSHDAFDNMTFRDIVGRDKNYPDTQYALAYFEIFDRYLIPRLGKFLVSEKAKTAGLSKPKSESQFNTGFEDILTFSRNRNLSFIIYLHPELAEVNEGTYNHKGQLIIDFARANKIPILYGLEGAKEDQYRDNIHLNEQGQKHLSEILLPVLKEHINPENPV